MFDIVQDLVLLSLSAPTVRGGRESSPALREFQVCNRRLMAELQRHLDSYVAAAPPLRSWRCLIEAAFAHSSYERCQTPLGADVIQAGLCAWLRQHGTEHLGVHVIADGMAAYRSVVAAHPHANRSVKQHDELCTAFRQRALAAMKRLRCEYTVVSSGYQSVPLTHSEWYTVLAQRMGRLRAFHAAMHAPLPAAHHGLQHDVSLSMGTSDAKPMVMRRPQQPDVNGCVYVSPHRTPLRLWPQIGRRSPVDTLSLLLQETLLLAMLHVDVGGTSPAACRAAARAALSRKGWRVVRSAYATLRAVAAERVQVPVRLMQADCVVRGLLGAAIAQTAQGAGGGAGLLPVSSAQGPGEVENATGTPTIRGIADRVAGQTFTRGAGAESAQLTVPLPWMPGTHLCVDNLLDAQRLRCADKCTWQTVKHLTQAVSTQPTLARSLHKCTSTSANDAWLRSLQQTIDPADADAAAIDAIVSLCKRNDPDIMNGDPQDLNVVFQQNAKAVYDAAAAIPDSTLRLADMLRQRHGWVIRDRMKRRRDAQHENSPSNRALFGGARPANWDMQVVIFCIAFATILDRLAAPMPQSMYSQLMLECQGGKDKQPVKRGSGSTAEDATSNASALSVQQTLLERLTTADKGVPAACRCLRVLARADMAAADTSDNLDTAAGTQCSTSAAAGSRAGVTRSAEPPACATDRGKHSPSAGLAATAVAASAEAPAHGPMAVREAELLSLDPCAELEDHFAAVASAANAESSAHNMFADAWLPAGVQNADELALPAALTAKCAAAWNRQRNRVSKDHVRSLATLAHL